jgi:hypothetical protein
MNRKPKHKSPRKSKSGVICVFRAQMKFIVFHCLLSCGREKPDAIAGLCDGVRAVIIVDIARARG